MPTVTTPPTVVIHGTVFYGLYCYRRHSSARAGGAGYCYRAHICLAVRLESSAQFAVFRVVIRGTVCFLRRRAGRKFYCYSVHNLHFCGADLGCYRAHNSCRGQKRVGCYLRHNFKISVRPSPIVIYSTFPFCGLLFGAQFPICRIFARVVIRGTFPRKSPCIALRLLLFAAHFRKIPPRLLLSAAHFAKIRFPPAGVGILDTVPRKFWFGLLSAAQFKLSGFFCAGVVIGRTF